MPATRRACAAVPPHVSPRGARRRGEYRCIATSLHRKQAWLRQRLKHEPSLDELAEAFAVGRDDIVAAMVLHRNYLPLSLSTTYENPESGESLSVGDRVGAPDAETVALVLHAPLYDALESLDERGRRILRWRFWEGWSQQKVADTLGISQMHVSRLERKTLKRRRGVLQD